MLVQSLDCNLFGDEYGQASTAVEAGALASARRIGFRFTGWRTSGVEWGHANKGSSAGYAHDPLRHSTPTVGRAQKSDGQEFAAPSRLLRIPRVSLTETTPPVKFKPGCSLVMPHAQKTKGQRLRRQPSAERGERHEHGQNPVPRGYRARLVLSIHRQTGKGWQRVFFADRTIV